MHDSKPANGSATDCLSWGLMSVEFASRDLSAKYDRFARWYDSVEAVLEFLGVRKLRQAILSEASGKVLEVAVGTGKNLYYLPARLPDHCGRSAAGIDM